MSEEDIANEASDLSLGRKAGQSITLETSDGVITIMVSQRTRLRIRCPRSIHIVRTELLEGKK